MTPQQKVKWLILNAVEKLVRGKELPYPLENIDAIYASTTLCGMDLEVRGSGISTDINAPENRNYVGSSVATKMPDGSWVGWTFWYGGGKHGCPEEVPWIEEAYDLNCEEKEVTIKLQKFTKKGEQQ
jgi:hypothetical protein